VITTSKPSHFTTLDTIQAHCRPQPRP